MAKEEYQREWRKKHPEYYKEYNKKHPERKEKQKEYNKTYRKRHPEKAIAYYKRNFKKKQAYRKEYLKKYFHTPEGIEIRRKCGRKVKARRRHLGFTPLNKWFKGSEAHHIDKERVIYIPKALHRSVWHSQTSGVGMELINKLALKYLKTTYHP